MKTTASLLRSIQSIAQDFGWHADLYRTLSTHTNNARYINTLTCGTPNALILWRERGKPSILHLGFLWEIEGLSISMIEYKIRSAVSRVEEAA